MQTFSQAKNESKNQKKYLATKSGFGNFLPKPDLAAKFFGLSMIFTNSAILAAKFFFGNQKWFWQASANSKMQ
jgi:hypothetical protein